MHDKVTKSITLFAILVTACVYSFTGFVPPGRETIYIYPFGNETTRYGLENLVLEKIQAAFISDGRVKLVSEDKAKIKLKGVITGYERTVFSYTGTDEVEQYRLTVKVELTLLQDTVTLWQHTLTKWVNYPPDKDEDEVLEQLCTELGNDVVHGVIEGW